ncbi:hypothetical protein DXU06_10710 [Bradyrhizobium elkanii]
MSFLGPESTAMADAICRLVVHGAELGELERYYIVDVEARARGVVDAPLLERRGFRREWLPRLARAADTGAMSRMTGKQIADRILQAPAD